MEMLQLRVIERLLEDKWDSYLRKNFFIWFSIHIVTMAMVRLISISRISPYIWPVISASFRLSWWVISFCTRHFSKMATGDT